MNENRTWNQIVSEIKEYGIDRLKDGIGDDSFGCEIHNHLYNKDYFIVYTARAVEFLGGHGFKAIDKVQEYELDNFGEVTTDLSDPEKLVNMLAYVIGEEFLNESETLAEKWDDVLSDEDIQNIITELES